jgi:hypothetical protein
MVDKPEFKIEDDVDQSIVNRGEGFKAMWYEVFCLYTEAVRADDDQRTNKFRQVLVDTLNNSADDVTRMSLVIRKHQS